MTDRTTFIDREDFQKKVGRITSDFSDRYGKISALLTEDLTSIDTNTLHLIGKLLKPEDKLERVFYKLLGRSLLQSESLAGGSAVLGLQFALSLFRTLFQSDEFRTIPDTELLKEFDSLLTLLREDIQAAYQVPTVQDLESHIGTICDNPLLSKVVFESVKLAGLQGKIYIENGRQSNYVVERKTGYNFKTKPFKFFLDASSNCWERQEVRVLLIDGVVEQVSEIDQI